MNRGWLLPSALVLVSILACGLPGSVTPDVDEVATQVAATLTALAAGAPEAPPPTTPAPMPLSTEPPPVATPAGPQVVYVQAGNVWLWTPDGGALQLTTTGDAERLWLAPDGSQVAFTRRPAYERVELWTVPTGGGTPQRLMSVEDFRSIDPAAERGVGPAWVAWVPGTRLLAFNTLAIPEPPPQDSEVPAPDYHLNLWLVDTEALEARPVLAPGEGGFFFFSPSGAQVAVSSYTQLTVMNTDGSARRVVLTYPFMEGVYGYHFFAKVVWSPDERSLMTVVPVSETGFFEDARDVNVVLVPLDGSGERVVNTIPYDWPIMGIAPGLDFLAYRRWDFEARQNELHLARVDGSDEMVYAAGPDLYAFAWAPAPGSGRFAYELGGAVFVGQVGRPPTEAYRYGAGKRLQAIHWLDASRLLVALRGESRGPYELAYVEVGDAPSVVTVGYADEGPETFDGR